VKFVNRQKLNSHLWFFLGFCVPLNPRYVYIFDAGVNPLPNSIQLLFENFEFDSNVGGLCGYMDL
jgi:chitin synthase